MLKGILINCYYYKQFNDVHPPGGARIANADMYVLSTLLDIVLGLVSFASR